MGKENREPFIIRSKSKTEDPSWWISEWVWSFRITDFFLPFYLFSQNSVPIAPKQASELKAIMSQFPVSSGKQHQKVENTWVPVTTPNTAATSTVTTVATISKPLVTLQSQIQEQLPELTRPKPPPEPPKKLDPILSKPYDWKSDQHYLSKSIIPELAPPPLVSFNCFLPLKSYFQLYPRLQPPCDVSDIISQRLNAMRKLQENPADSDASKILNETQQNVRNFCFCLNCKTHCLCNPFRCLYGRNQNIRLVNSSAAQTTFVLCLPESWLQEAKRGLERTNSLILDQWTREWECICLRRWAGRLERVLEKRVMEVWCRCCWSWSLTSVVWSRTKK